MRFSLVLVAVLVALLGSVVEVDAHAKLVSPMPWNPQPTKQQVCGVSAAAAVPTKYVVSQVNTATPLIVKWQIVIADGRGPLTAKIDTTAKTNPSLADFKVSLTTTPGTLNNPQLVSNTPYTISFQIPAGTTCTGTGGICTLRVASSSGWVACSTIKLIRTAASTLVTDNTTATDAPTTAIPVDDTIMPLPTTPAPVYPTPIGSNGIGGALGIRQVLSTESSSGLEYIINAASPQVEGRPQGVIIFLHGETASNYVYGLTMFAKVAAQYDFIRVSVLAPNGEDWSKGDLTTQVTWANMLNNLIQLDLKSAYNIDLAKIFLTGQSSGGKFLSQYFVPLHAKDIAGGVFFQCGASSPAIQFQPSAATQANVKLHFEITADDLAFSSSFTNAITAYTATGMKLTMLNTKPGGHCAFDQQQVILDRLPGMLPQPINAVDTDFKTQDATGQLVVFSAEASPKTRCVVASGLTACPKVNGQSVQLLTTSDLTMVDMAAENAITFGLNNKDIITTTPSTDCQQAYRDMICAAFFTPCGSGFTTTCQTSCRQANQVCSFNQTLVEGSASHASMYDCTQSIYQEIYADANGICAGAPGALGGGDANGAISYASPMMFMTLLISFIAILLH